MAKLNVARIITSGLVIGVVLNILGIVGNGVILRDAWDKVAANLRPPQVGVIGRALLGVIGLLSDFVLAWALVGFYAAARPSLGAGISTVAKIAAALWVVGVVMPYTGLVRLGIVPLGLAVATCTVALVSFVPAVWLSVRLYRDAPSASAA